MSAHGKPFNDPQKPGRRDVNGVEWWACDPYPTWYRWDWSIGSGRLYTNPAEWDNEPQPPNATGTTEAVAYQHKDDLESFWERMRWIHGDDYGPSFE